MFYYFLVAIEEAWHLLVESVLVIHMDMLMVAHMKMIIPYRSTRRGQQQQRQQPMAAPQQLQCHLPLRRQWWHQLSATEKLRRVATKIPLPEHGVMAAVGRATLLHPLIRQRQWQHLRQLLPLRHRQEEEHRLDLLPPRFLPTTNGHRRTTIRDQRECFALLSAKYLDRLFGLSFRMVYLTRLFSFYRLGISEADDLVYDSINVVNCQTLFSLSPSTWKHSPICWEGGLFSFSFYF